MARKPKPVKYSKGYKPTATTLREGAHDFYENFLLKCTSITGLDNQPEYQDSQCWKDIAVLHSYLFDDAFDITILDGFTPDNPDSADYCFYETVDNALNFLWAQISSLYSLWQTNKFEEIFILGSDNSEGNLFPLFRKELSSRVLFENAVQLAYARCKLDCNIAGSILVSDDSGINHAMFTNEEINLLVTQNINLSRRTDSVVDGLLEAIHTGGLSIQAQNIDNDFLKTNTGRINSWSRKFYSWRSVAALLLHRSNFPFTKFTHDGFYIDYTHADYFADTFSAALEDNDDLYKFVTKDLGIRGSALHALQQKETGMLFLQAAHIDYKLNNDIR